jgi:hypothetical protein
VPLFNSVIPSLKPHWKILLPWVKEIVLPSPQRSADLVPMLLSLEFSSEVLSCMFEITANSLLFDDQFLLHHLVDCGILNFLTSISGSIISENVTLTRLHLFQNKLKRIRIFKRLQHFVSSVKIIEKRKKKFMREFSFMRRAEKVVVS